MRWLSAGASARDACCAARRVLDAINVVSRHHARPARGGSRSRPSAPSAEQRADAARCGQHIKHACWLGGEIAGGARPRSLGRPITTAARSRMRRSARRSRPCGQASCSSRWLRIKRTARNHCVLGQTSGRRAPSHVFCSVFVEDAKSSRNECKEFSFTCRRRLPQDVCVQQRIGAAGARLPQKHMAWRRGRGAPAGKAPPRN